jgi:hypothetical protein
VSEPEMSRWQALSSSAEATKRDERHRPKTAATRLGTRLSRASPSNQVSIQNSRELPSPNVIVTQALRKLLHQDPL